MSAGIRDGLVQLSCVLSMLGSALVILTWAYPRKNRNKHGRILLLWLSVADLLSSCIYFIQTFHTDGNDICEISALLGIYFPVASFLWTDCIAYFLYLVVFNRTDYQPYNWTKLLRYFHVFVWSLSLVTIILVLAFGHAGYSSDDDANDNGGSNTGGWCWIKADSPRERFIWEVIGGKLIEWMSCLVVLPYLYTSVYYQLAKVEGQSEVRETLDTTTGEDPESQGRETPPSPMTQPTRNALNPADRRNKPLTVAVDVRRSPTELGDGIPNVKSIESLYDLSDLSGNAFIDPVSARNSYTTTSEANVISAPASPLPAIQHTGLSRPSKVESRRASTGSHSNALFSQFYLKLAAVPLVLILIRIWSSVRIILQYAYPHEDNADAFFEVMQAIFDPSQGIFNALIFVCASAEDRQNLYIIFAQARRYLWACLTCQWRRRSSYGSGSYNSSNQTGEIRERLIPGGARAKANSASSSTHQSLLDISVDYECDSNERLSEFSFDLTDNVEG